MRVMVTGANGFVGRILCEQLGRSGFKVRVVMCRSYSDLKVDIQDQAVDPLVEFRLVNRDGTIRLAEQAARMGVRLWSKKLISIK